MSSVLLAAIRIRLPRDVAEALLPWAYALIAALVVVVVVSLTARLWKVWGVAAWAIDTLTETIVRLFTHGVGSLNPTAIVLTAVDSAVLVWAALAVWGLRRQVDVKGALMAAVAYAVVVTAARWAVLSLWIGGGRPIELIGLVVAAGFAAGLLVTLALAVAYVSPLSRAAFIGLAVGTVVGAVLAQGVRMLLQPLDVQGSLFLIGRAVAAGLILGGLAFAAIRWLKPEEQAGRVVLAPAGRA